MPASQLFEGREASALRIGNQFRILILKRADEIHIRLTLYGRFAIATEIHCICYECDGRGEIRFDSQTHLESIREIIERGYHFAFQNLFLSETKPFKT